MTQSYDTPDFGTVEHELNNARIELSNANAVIATRDREVNVLTRQVDELAKLRHEAEARADAIANTWKEGLRSTLIQGLEEQGLDEGTIQWIADEYGFTLKETYEVEVSITMNGTVVVEVEATSEDDARRMVDDFDDDFENAFEEAIRSNVDPSDFESEINGVEYIRKQ